MNITITHRNEAVLPPKMYGVWIPHKGWLWATTPTGRQVYTEVNKKIAENTARRCSSGAHIMFIDNALRDLEGYFLEVEKEIEQ